MGLKIRVGDREPIALVLRRFRKLLERNGIVWSMRRSRWFVKPTQLRRKKRFRKWLKSSAQTYLAKRAGLQ
jgi:ribosomal protein S21